MKTDIKDQQTSSKTANAKKQRTGRWSQRQVYLFESLLERYGKNWKKIHEHMRIRSLSQIRSHAQKYFEKIGPKKVQEFQRRAKLLEAYEILEKEKRDGVEAQKLQESSEEKRHIFEEEKIEAEIENEEPRKQQTEFQSSSTGKLSEIIKLQAPQSAHIVQNQAPQIDFQHLPIFYNSFDNSGFLLTIIHQNFESFRNYGFSAFIDNPQFRTAAPLQFV